jgi:hypothetical protein
MNPKNIKNAMRKFSKKISSIDFNKMRNKLGLSCAKHRRS